jgi:predicted HD phosphohydrolase
LSELDHGLQCAAELKAMAPDDIELQIAGLVHDISHGQCHIRDHGDIGGAAVRHVLGERVAALVQRHVAAKRYLISLDQSYLARLSPTSIKTFELQGGLMTTAEIETFAADPHRDDAIRVREADDAAKVPGRDVPGLDSWRDALRRVAANA